MADARQAFLSAIENDYKLKPLEAGEFKDFQMNGMDFHVDRYEIEGLGYVTWMTASGMNGAMKMDTVILNAFEKDLPMFSYDRINAMGKDTIIVEIYDTMLDKAYSSKGFEEASKKLASLPDMPANGEHWYDAIRYKESIAKVAEAKDAQLLDETLLAFLEQYLKEAKNAPNCDRAAKIIKASEYPTNLVEQGGFAADNYIKAIGKEKTREFFRNVLFNA